MKLTKDMMLDITASSLRLTIDLLLALEAASLIRKRESHGKESA